MKFIIGNSYRIVFDVGGKALSFSCKIISDDDMFVTFKDKFGKELNYRKDTIISYEEIEIGSR